MELVLDNLTKQYRGKTVVRNVSATMNTGLYGLLGANGAGKTTLIRMLATVLSPSSGRIFFDGADTETLGDMYRDRLGYMPQDFGFYPSDTPENFLRYVAALKGLPKPYADRRIKLLLETTGLSDARKKRVRTFSGGMKRRLGIAQALLNDPKIVILDEPTAGLDPKERVRFRNLLTDLASERIVLLSTHIVADIEAVADFVYLMKDGQFAAAGTLSDITKAADGFVWELKTDAAGAAKWQEMSTVAAMRREGDKTVLKVIRKDRPDASAVPVPPTLEDLYLYHFPAEGGRLQ